MKNVKFVNDQVICYAGFLSNTAVQGNVETSKLLMEIEYLKQMNDELRERNNVLKANSSLLDEQDRTEVQYNKKKQKTFHANKNIICNGTQNSAKPQIFQAATKRKWIYIGRIASKQVSENDILQYMNGLNSFENIAFDAFFRPDGIAMREFTFSNNLFSEEQPRKSKVEKPTNTSIQSDKDFCLILQHAQSIRNAFGKLELLVLEKKA
ncbi:hypothetical protein WA026_020542 [Henosepilachna vigintioctopunctata]|uniref:Uncharacterized protein n=1 Tax=Henosepilachna vigintioctopunctata TaxID=420089 RepID=A0AAW1VA52_9CUCU